MKEDYLRIRMSKRRMDKLRLYAQMKDTTMTHVIEDFIDSLKIPDIDKNSTVPLPVNPAD
ncbi:hypothetical protein [Trichormus variabilis]|uniref:Uncharacterized protein n=1 Tax=Trichormus variabilis SAG 1403-4b TaxID=447716 RepID=A0A433UPF8_ANAVA|nr:hypothetical protein [Trichormus variabilis]MBD2626570.1 hypothetical protein [Trichormus variabilis FACHB-164]RUS95692.1 hypothetical protein DSM107003_28680 [Trichormus variabilis SAG 1403-4b]